MANGHGGKRAGAGRKSTRNEYVDDGLETPIEYLLKLMRAKRTPRSVRIDCAKAAAPYCHARLQSTFVEAEVVIEALNWDN